MAKNNGKALEAKISKVLKLYAAKNKSLDHRFVDKTQAMSGFVTAPPGDYMLLTPGGAILIEAKSTNTGRGLLSLAHKNKIQIASHRMWARAGHPSLYLYMDLESDVIEWHLGTNVVEKINKPLFIGKSAAMLSSLSAIVEDL